MQRCISSPSIVTRVGVIIIEIMGENFRNVVHVNARYVVHENNLAGLGKIYYNRIAP